jgi:hypothetical protein
LISANGICSCIVALLARRRLSRSAKKSVENRPQAAKIGELPKRGCVVDIVDVASGGAVRLVPIGPCCRKERSTAVRQNDEQEQRSALLQSANYTKRPALEGMPSTPDGHFARIIAVMGSVAMLPSTTSTTAGFAGWWRIASAIQSSWASSVNGSGPV